MAVARLVIWQGTALLQMQVPPLPEVGAEVSEEVIMVSRTTVLPPATSAVDPIIMHETARLRP